MTNADNELDEYGKKVLEPLRPTPNIDPKVQADEKVRFLLQAEKLQKNLVPRLAETRQASCITSTLGDKLSLPVYKVLVVVILLLIFIGGSTFTVYAAQSSLPGEPLYTIKSLSEDIHLSMTFSTKAKLNLTLDYTNRRMSEIRNLVSRGKSLPDQTSVRYQHELEDALQLAAQMDDTQMQVALNEIKYLAENQGISMEELIANLPEQASPAIIRIQERLQEQVQLSAIGENNPQEFRLEIRERAHSRQGPKKSATSDLPGILPTLATIAVTPSPQDDSNGNEMHKSTQAAGHSNADNGQGQSTPGNGNHGPNPTHTP